MPIGQRPLGEAPMIATDRAESRFSTGLRVNVFMIVSLLYECLPFNTPWLRRNPETATTHARVAGLFAVERQFWIQAFEEAFRLQLAHNVHVRDIACLLI